MLDQLRVHRTKLVPKLVHVVVEPEGEPAGFGVLDRELATTPLQLVVGHASTLAV